MKTKGFGLIELAIVVGAFAALAATIFGGVHMWNNHMDSVRSEARTAGRTSALKEVADRDNKALLAANAKIKELSDRLVTLQAELDKRIVEIDNAYSEGVKDGNEKKAAVIADLRSGRLVLRDPGAEDRGRGPGSGVQPVPSATGGVGCGDGKKAAPLSARLSEFLIGKFSDADNDLRQLAAAQDAVTALLGALDKCRAR